MPKFSAAKKLSRPWTRLALGAALAVTGAASLPATALASSSQIAIIQDGSDLTNPFGAMQEFRQLGATTVRVIVPWAQIAPSPTKTKKPNFNATDPNAYPKAGLGPVRRDRAGRQAVRDDGVLRRHRRRAALGRGPKPLGNPGESLAFLAWKPNAAAYGQFVQAMGTRYDGHFTPKGQKHAAAGGAVLVALQRAELRLGPRSPGEQRLHGADRADDVPRAGQRRLEGAAEDRPRPRHDPDRRVRRPGVRARPVPQEDRGPSRLVWPDQAAAVHPRALLPGHQLQAAARQCRQGRRVPDDRRRVTEVPQPESRAVQRQRRRRPPLPAGPVPGEHVGQSGRLRHVPRPRPPSSARWTGPPAPTARARSSRSTTPSTATSPHRRRASRTSRRRPRPSTSTGPST